MDRIDISGRCTICLSENGDILLLFDGRSLDLPNLSAWEKARIGNTFLDAASSKRTEEEAKDFLLAQKAEDEAMDQEIYQMFMGYPIGRD